LSGGRAAVPNPRRPESRVPNPSSTEPTLGAAAWRVAQRSRAVNREDMAKSRQGEDPADRAVPMPSQPAVRLPEALATALAEYDRHVRFERGLAAHTVRAYRGDVAQLLEHASRMAVTSPAGIDVGVLRSWLAASRSRGRVPATLARRAAAARSFTALATSRGWSTVDAGLTLVMPRSRGRLPHVLTEAQAAALLDEPPRSGTDEPADIAIRHRDSALLETLYATAIRVSELCGLNVDDVDFSSRVMRVLGKGSKERIVPFGVPAARALERWLSAGRPLLYREKGGAALFLGRRGGRIDVRTVRRTVHSAVMDVPGAPDIGPHGLRHSAATHLVDGGANLRNVQELLGHATLATTQLYTHISVDRLRATYERAHPRA
jgi:integrase/recombinase XerC